VEGVQVTLRVIKLTVVIIVEYHCYQFHIKFYRLSLRTLNYNNNNNNNNNNKTDLREIGWCGLDWIDLSQDRDQWRALGNTVVSRQVP
jgi:hypothetical protein